MSTTTANTAPIQEDNSQKQEEIDINLEDPQVKEAAKKIQSVFRVKRVADKKAADAKNEASQ